MTTQNNPKIGMSDYKLMNVISNQADLRFITWGVKSNAKTLEAMLKFYEKQLGKVSDNMSKLERYVEAHKVAEDTVRVCRVIYRQHKVEAERLREQARLVKRAIDRRDRRK